MIKFEIGKFYELEFISLGNRVHGIFQVSDTILKNAIFEYERSRDHMLGFVLIRNLTNQWIPRNLIVIEDALDTTFSYVRQLTTEETVFECLIMP